MPAGRRPLLVALCAALAPAPSALAASAHASAEQTARPPFTPSSANCFSASGYTLVTPRLENAVHLTDDGRATVAWVTTGGVVMSAAQDPSGAWGTPQAVSGSAAVQSAVPALAGDGRGNLVIAWVRGDRVQVAMRSAAGAWGPARTISRARQRFVSFVQTPLIAVGPRGQVALAWASIGPSHITRFRDGSIGISGSPHVELALGAVTTRVGGARLVPLDRAQLDAQTLALGMDADGTPVLASSSGGRAVVTGIESTRGLLRPASIRRLVARPLRGPSGLVGSYSEPTIARGPDRHLALAWTSNGVVTVSVRSPGGSWGRTAAVSRPPAVAGEPRIAVGRGGRVEVSWLSVARAPRPGRPGYRSRTIWVASRAASGAWQPAVRLTAPSVVASYPEIALDGQGTALAVFALGTNGVSGRDSTVGHATRGSMDRVWSPGAALSTAGVGPLFPRIATSAAGDAVAVWSRCASRRRSEARIEVVGRPARSQAWSPVVRIDSP